MKWPEELGDPHQYFDDPPLHGRTNGHAPEPTLPALPFIDMTGWDDMPVPDQEWAVLNRIPLRQCALFSGEGSAGKSTTQLHLSAATVLGRDWLGTMPEQGPALFVDAEDDHVVIHRRLAAIAAHYGVRFADLVKGGLHLISLVGHDAVLATANRAGRIEPTTLYKQLLEAAADIRPKMIGLASSANLYAGSEIDRAQVQQFISLLTRMAIAANGSVVLISHPSLTGIKDDTGLSGNTQWHNAVRARFYMKSVKAETGEQPDTDLREIVFKKNQYGPIAETIVLRYRDGLFLPEAGISTLERANYEMKVDAAFLAALRQRTDQRQPTSISPNSPSYYLPRLLADLSPGFRLKDAEAAQRRLLNSNRIHIRDDGKPSRSILRLYPGPSPTAPGAEK